MKTTESGTRPPLSPGFMAVVVFKYAKLAAFLLFGSVVLKLARGRDQEAAAQAANLLDVNHQDLLLHRLADVLRAITPGQEKALAAASIFAGLVFGAEGTCLLLRLWWAPYFTIVLTALGIPLELGEIARHPGGVRGYVLLAANVAVLVYVWRRRNDFRKAGPDRGITARRPGRPAGSGPSGS